MTVRKNQHHALTLVSPLSVIGDSGAWLRIEQPDWPEPPDGGFFQWLFESGKGFSLQTLNEYWAQYKSWCNEDGTLEVEIQIHRSPADLPYGISASWGELSDVFRHVGDHNRSETIRGVSEFDLESQIIGTVQTTWEGPVLGSNGKPISPPPTVRLEGSTLKWGVKATGVFRIKYSEEHDAYILTITPREAGEYEADNLETAYQSTVFAVHSGGEVEDHEVDLPNMSGYCNGGGNAIVDPDDDEDGLPCTRHTDLVDACSLEVIDQWDTEIPCPGGDE